MSLYPRPHVAIVGRPNVGKSTLINRIVGQRAAIVHDEPGVTRDRAYYIGEWQGQKFTVVDTGGVYYTSDDEKSTFGSLIREQMNAALDEADMIVMLVDGQTGVTQEDMALAAHLRQIDKPVKIAANKLDSPTLRLQVSEFYQLGLDEPLAMSALHGDGGVGDLLEWVTKSDLMPDKADFEELPPQDEADLDRPIRIAFLGRPNVGKSSLVNALLGEDRNIVSDISGTTRDSIDTPFTVDGKDYLLVDTAGIRRKAKVGYGVEMFSVDRALDSLHRADVAVLVIDATEGITNQEQRLAEKVRDKGKPLIIVVNKWDLQTDKHTTSTQEYQRKMMTPHLPHVTFAPVLFVSAKSGQRVPKILGEVNRVFENANRRIQTSVINQIITEAYSLSPPKVYRNKIMKIYYATQVGAHPPTFVLFVNDALLMQQNYLRYIERRLRENIDFVGTPIVIHWRNRQTKGKPN